MNKNFTINELFFKLLFITCYVQGKMKNLATNVCLLLFSTTLQTSCGSSNS